MLSIKNLSRGRIAAGIVVMALVGAGIGFYFGTEMFSEEPVQRGCTMEARLCPDGSYVGRTGPNCEFAPCPDGEGEREIGQ